MQAELQRDVDRVSQELTVVRPSSNILEDVEVSLPDGARICINVSADATGEAVKRQILQEYFQTPGRWGPLYSTLRFCGADYSIGNTDIVGEAGCGLQAGGRLYFEKDDNDDFPAVVIDNGSYMMKTGCSGEDSPKATFSSVVGYHKSRHFNDTGPDYFIGEEAQQKRGILILKYPIEHGVVQNWDDMEKIWRHTYNNELRMVVGDENIEDEDCVGVLHTETPMTPVDNRERMTQIQFETFGVRNFYAAVGPWLALAASGRTTGLVVDSGSSVTHIVPTFNGACLHKPIQRINVGGRHLTDYLCKIHAGSMAREVARGGSGGVRLGEGYNKAKEDLCWVSMNFQHEVDDFAGKEKRWEDPCTGGVATFHNELIRVPEIMFRPSLDGKSMMGLHEITMKTVHDCPLPLCSELLKNVVLCGGNTMFPNFEQRLQNELQEMVNEGTQIKVIAPPERIVSTWFGGSIMTSLSTFDRMWINRESDPDANRVGYEEIGPRIVHQMCTSDL